MRLSAEPRREALARDAALLARVEPRGRPLVRWYTLTAPAVVVGLGLRHRIPDVVDLDRCRRAGVEVLERQAGGGAVLLDSRMLCLALCVALPDARVSNDLTESYRWLGDHFATRLHAQRVEVDQARADVAGLRASPDPVDRLLLATCYGALSPHEVVLDGRKLVGLAQVRRRHAALFQIGVLLRDQAPLADLLNVPDAPTRERLRDALAARTIGLPEDQNLEELALLLEPDQLA